ncbi:hypothetical protein LP419_18445 [Massilia sp. H-1]|nr:hypothetical protein LP419_18445 [Massilia sp. H-1]
MADGIGLLYADYPLLARADFTDFQVNMRHSRGVRRFAGRQVLFDHDGHTPFKPLPVDQAFPMFEWAMNWCVSSRAHDYLVIHAAVVERDGFAAILCRPRPVRARARCARPWSAAAGACCPTS